jgi:hypothetical protein
LRSLSPKLSTDTIERIDVFPDRDTWRSRLHDYVDEHAAEIVTDLSGLVRIPSAARLK